MGYRAGIGGGLQAMGLYPQEPHIYCDACGVTRPVSSRVSFAAKWFLNGKAAPGWAGGRNEDHTRTDYCPRCKGAAKKTGG